MGLSISRQLAGVMNGDISVKSHIGKGSCFTVRLQAAGPDLAPANDTDFSSLAAASPPSSTGKKLSVLYIEDDPVNALVLDHMVDHLGEVELHHADTASKGLQMLSSLTVDLIVLDMNLPDGHGLDVVHMIRDQVGFAGTPIVALSADALPDAIVAARAAGFDGYLTKPIDLSAVERLLAGVREGLPNRSFMEGNPVAE